MRSEWLRVYESFYEAAEKEDLLDDVRPVLIAMCKLIVKRDAEIARLKSTLSMAYSNSSSGSPDEDGMVAHYMTPEVDAKVREAIGD